MAKKNKQPLDNAATGATKEQTDDNVREKRFSTARRPQFQKPSVADHKVELDERFAAVLTDPRFQLPTADKYGRQSRKKRESERTQHELSEFYTVKAAGQNDNEDDPSSHDSSSADGNDNKRQDGSQDKSDAEEELASRIAYLTALSRGQYDVSSTASSQSDDSADKSVSEDDASGIDPELGRAGVLDPSFRLDGQLANDNEADRTDEPSQYLAVTNMDWEHVRAVDIFALLSSFCAPGALQSVRVYPSDFGRQRMIEEERLGPRGLWKVKKKAEYIANHNDGSAGADDAVGGAEDLKVNDEGFDEEKLRAYEASKLKYYFAVASFRTSADADVAYREVDGMEFEHSSAAVDLRAIAPNVLDSVVDGRKLRDEASHLPSNYDPPDFVVSALQQTTVQCTWEAGDVERERMLTKYTSGSNWQAMAEEDDLKAYLASDASSADNCYDSDNGDEKAKSMRRLLGLDNSDNGSDAGSDGSDNIPKSEKMNDESSTSESASRDDEVNDTHVLGVDDRDVDKTMSYVPGQPALEDKIRAKLDSASENREGSNELTTFEKYKLKKRQKRREKRQSAKLKRGEVQKSREDTTHPGKPSDEFFAGEDADGSDNDRAHRRPATANELALLADGDDEQQVERDFDMRGLQRMEQLKDKKLRGKRKRKEEKRQADVTGANFELDTGDERFQALLDGADDRFGIDRTDPSYRETPAMESILTEQSKRRRHKEKPVDRNCSSQIIVVPNVSAETTDGMSSGASALSSLVSSLKNKVAANKRTGNV